MTIQFIKLLLLINQYYGNIKTAYIVTNFLIKIIPLLKFLRNRVQKSHVHVDYISMDDIEI